MGKYQQFTWKEFPPGTDYGSITSMIKGKPGALKDGLDDIASALGYLDSDYWDLELAAGYLNEALDRHGLAWEGGLSPYGLAWGKVSSPGTKGLKFQQFKRRKECPWDNSDRPFVGPQTALKEAIRDIDDALGYIVEVSDFGQHQDEVQEGADILIWVLERHGLIWKGEIISSTPVVKEEA